MLKKSRVARVFRDAGYKLC